MFTKERRKPSVTEFFSSIGCLSVAQKFVMPEVVPAEMD